MDKLTERQLSARYNSLRSQWEKSNNVEVLAALLKDAVSQADEAYKINDVNERQTWLRKYQEMANSMTERITKLAAIHLEANLPDDVKYKEDKDI